MIWSTPTDESVFKYRETGGRKVRRLGYALDQATLQQIAYNHGINQSISTMTQAEKSQLRFVAIMEQSKNVMGDMARTVMTPANAMRILQQQVTQLSRALGNILIPILTTILPYIQAFVMVLTEAAQAIANLFGFQLPTIDYSGADLSGVSQGADTATDSLENATEAAKDLKQYTLGFDELNILSPVQDTAVSGSPGLGGGDLGLDLSEYDYDFLGEIENKAKEIAEKIKKFFREWGDLLKIVGGLLAGIWAINKIRKFVEWVKAAYDFIRNLKVVRAAVKAWNLFTEGFLAARKAGEGFFASFKTGLRNIGNNMTVLQKVTGSVIALGAEFLIISNRTKEFALGNISLGEALLEVSATLGLVGTAMYAMLGPTGLVLTAITGMVAAVVGLGQAEKELRLAMVEETFFDGQGVAIQTLADKYIALMQSTINAKQPVIDMGNAIETGTENIQNTAAEMDNLIRQIELGAVSAEEAIPRIKEQLNSIYNDTLTNLTNARNLILYALANSMKTADEAATEHLNDLSQKTNTMISGMEENVQELYKEIEREIKAGNLPIDKISEFMEVTGQGKLTVEDFQTSLENLDLSDIDWGDMDQASGAIESVSNTMNEGLKSIDDYYKKIDDTIAYLKTQATTAEDLAVIDQLLEFSQEAKAKDVEAFKATATEFLTTLQKDILLSSQDQMEKVMDDWDSLSWLDKLWYVNDPDNFVREKMNTYRTDIVGPLTTQMKEAFSDALGEDTVWADDAMNEMFNNLFSLREKDAMMDSSQYMGYVTEFAQSVSGTMGEALSANMGVAAVDTIQGFANGIRENTSAASNAMGTMVTGKGGILDSFDTAMDSHSPSKEMVTRGLWAMEGLAQGISDNAHLVTGALESLTGQMTEAMTQVAQQMASAFKGALLQAVQALSMDTAWSQNIVNTLLSAIFTPGGMGMMGGGMMGSMGMGGMAGDSYTPYVTAFAENLLAVMNEILPPQMQQGALAAVNGFVEGIELHTPLASEAMRVLVEEEKGILPTFDQAMDAKNAPSKEMEKRGLWAMQGLEKAIKENTPLVTDQIKELSRQIIELMDKLVADVRSRVESILAEVERAKAAIQELSSLSVSGSFSVNAQVRGFASGGFPKEGQMFLARESGPELVGSIGGRSAVANNDQIVEAVSIGVYQAVVSAMNRGANTGESITVHVTLDGEKIYQNQEEIRRNKGYSFGMGAFAR